MLLTGLPVLHTNGFTLLLATLKVVAEDRQERSTEERGRYAEKNGFNNENTNVDSDMTSWIIPKRL
jgi:hypothetical protein